MHYLHSSLDVYQIARLEFSNLYPGDAENVRRVCIYISLLSV